MGRMPIELKKNIARNIKDCRLRKFPGRGGSKQCAEAFGVTPQQWSPWENGHRTPDEVHLEKIASFFQVTVEDLRRDNRTFPAGAPLDIAPPPGISLSQSRFSDAIQSDDDFARQAALRLESSDNAANVLWLAQYFVFFLKTYGLVLHLSSENNKKSPPLP